MPTSLANFHDLPRWKRCFEKLSFLLTLYAVTCLLIEMEVSKEDKSEGWWLWNERTLATIFTIEYLFRWTTSHDRQGHPLRPMAIIDLMSIAPFYVGFLVNDDTLDLIRILRVLRILRLYRFSTSLVLIHEAYARCRAELWTVASFVGVVTIIASAFMFQLEHAAQPDKVAKFSDAAWWTVVTMATVGYGDIAPITIGGRILATITIVIGVGSYGVMLSLFGGAWVEVLKEQRTRP